MMVNRPQSPPLEGQIEVCSPQFFYLRVQGLIGRPSCRLVLLAILELIDRGIWAGGFPCRDIVVCIFIAVPFFSCFCKDAHALTCLTHCSTHSMQEPLPTFFFAPKFDYARLSQQQEFMEARFLVYQEVHAHVRQGFSGSLHFSLLMQGGRAGTGGGRGIRVAGGTMRSAPAFLRPPRPASALLRPHTPTGSSEILSH